MEYQLIYDNNSTPAKGHLFLPHSDIALCGRKKSKMGAPILERIYTEILEVPNSYFDDNGKHCITCCCIAHKIHYIDEWTF